jgi:hypothetical protein
MNHFILDKSPSNLKSISFEQSMVGPGLGVLHFFLHVPGQNFLTFFPVPGCSFLHLLTGLNATYESQVLDDSPLNLKSGSFEQSMVGAGPGNVLGTALGNKLSFELGKLGTVLGKGLGKELGAKLTLGSAVTVGTVLGLALVLELGSTLGVELRTPLGIKLGFKLGTALGFLLGSTLGTSLGD